MAVTMKNDVFWVAAPCRYCAADVSEAIRSSETSVYTTSTRRYIPEDGIFQNHVTEFRNVPVPPTRYCVYASGHSSKIWNNGPLYHTYSMLSA
jgi:hypothetical protein